MNFVGNINFHCIPNKACVVNCYFSLFLFRFFIGDSQSSYSKAKAFVVVVVVDFVVLVFFFQASTFLSKYFYNKSIAVKTDFSSSLCDLQANKCFNGRHHPIPLTSRCLLVFVASLDQWRLSIYYL